MSTFIGREDGLSDSLWHDLRREMELEPCVNKDINLLEDLEKLDIEGKVEVTATGPSPGGKNPLKEGTC